MDFYRRWDGVPSLCDTARVRGMRPVLDCPDKMFAQLVHMKKLGFDTEPMHLLVPSAGERKKRNGYVFHVWNSAIPHKAFYKISDELYICSPEFIFLQMASVLEMWDLIRFGYELCAEYRLDSEGNRHDSEPLTTVAGLTAFVERAGSSPGVRKARKALKWVCDGSASPKETVVAMIFTLPTKLGGYGFPKPELNKSFPVADDPDGRAIRRADFFWRQFNFAVEYQSDECHAWEYALAPDAVREKSLDRLGITTLNLTLSELKNGLRFDAAIKSIARRIGVRLREPSDASAELRWRLRNYALKHQLPLV